MKGSRQKAQEWPHPRHKDYEAELQRTAAAWFGRKGLPTHRRYPYILAEWEQWPSNIIVPEVAEYVRRERERREAERVGFPLHRYIHHGLSSQAMLLNLVGPLIVRGDLAPLRVALAESGVPWPTGEVRATLEVEDRRVFHEDYGQPTSIDLVLASAEGTEPLYVEAKLVEREFGGCSVFAAGDCDGRNPARDPSLCYLHHIGRLYWARMAEHGFLEGALGASPICPLATYYQFYREVLFALCQGGRFVLLSDRRNPAFHGGGPRGQRGLLPFLVSLAPTAVAQRISHLTIQAVVQAVRQSARHSDWVGEFASRYGLDPQAAT